MNTDYPGVDRPGGSTEKSCRDKETPVISFFVVTGHFL